MSGSDPNDETRSTDLPQTPPPEQPVPSEDVTTADETTDPSSAAPEKGDASPQRRILIGSQRDPDAYRPAPRHDWKPIIEPHTDATGGRAEAVESPAPTATPAEPIAPPETPPEPTSPPPSIPADRIPPPNIRAELPADLAEQFNEALSDASFDDLMHGDAIAEQTTLEDESQHTGRVLTVRGDDVFIELGSREQGVVSAKQFDHLPEPGTTLEVIVRRFNVDEGLYELSIPNAAAEVGDWDDLHEGMIVEARVIGHNTGGLECEVNRLRAFIPVSQVALYRVDNLAQFVDEKFACVVTEVNPQRRNLVLSRRAVLEREKQETREKLLQSLQPGQTHEGVVRKLTDFGAFVDLGGIDGLLHVSQLAWHRVSHPSDVLSEGQTIKVKIEKIDHATGKMSLAYRDMLENPWQSAAQKYPPNSVAKGKVSKIMEFGAFVALEPGVEGLVHISELSHKRVWRATDVVGEGDEVEVLVLSVDPQAQRMSLSMKELLTPEPVEKGEEPKTGEPPAKPSKRNRPSKPLKGGLGRSAGGEGFGLKW